MVGTRYSARLPDADVCASGLQTQHYCDTLRDKLAPSFVADQMWMQRVHVIEPHDERR